MGRGSKEMLKPFAIFKIISACNRKSSSVRPEMIRKRRVIVESNTFNCSIAYLRPTQLRGPALNESNKAKRFFSPTSLSSMSSKSSRNPVFFAVETFLLDNNESSDFSLIALSSALKLSFRSFTTSRVIFNMMFSSFSPFCRISVHFLSIGAFRSGYAIENMVTNPELKKELQHSELATDATARPSTERYKTVIMPLSGALRKH
uniref:Uncharacterized protein n=1 Tax=Glossina pallidipes TaxID=7398 RepID=A0A1A9ZE66_GLOPL